MKPTSLASSSSEEEKVGEGEEKRRRRRKKCLPLKAALAAPGVRGLGGSEQLLNISQGPEP